MDALRTQRQQAAAAGDVETVIQCRNETGALTAQLWQARRNAATGTGSDIARLSVAK